MSGQYRRPARAQQAHTRRLRSERGDGDGPRRIDAVAAPHAIAFRGRVTAVLVCFALGWMLILGRAGWLALGPDERLEGRLKGQHHRVVEVAPQRGSIVDRLGRPLAVSVEMDSLYADPGMVEDADEAARMLAPLLNIDPKDLLAKLNRDDTRFVWLARQIAPDVAEQIDTLRLPGVRLTPEAHRDYPGGPLASQILGFVGVDGNGLEGIEARFNDELTGDAVQYRALRDGRRRTTNHAAVLGRRSTEGQTLVLTLDHAIQHRAERALQEAIERHEALAGWVVAMDPQTGAVLAMASSPGFDPNHFRGVDRDRIRHRAVSEVYEPGSVMKPFVIAEVLERGLAERDEEIYCERGAYRIGRRTVHDAHPHDTLTVDGVIKVSSNIGTVKLAERMGPAALEETLRRYGFGSKTGVDLYGEERGILRPHESWSDIGFATNTFGQGMAVTGLQLTAGFSELVNGGRSITPHVVAEVRDPRGELVTDRRPLVGEERILSEATSTDIRDMMAAVVGEGGTGTRARLEGYSSGGKTGTAQKVKNKRYEPGAYVSSFIGFAPVDNPRVVVLAVLDEPRNKYYGGTVAGPIFKEVARTALREFGVKPDLEREDALALSVPEPAPVLVDVELEDQSDEDEGIDGGLPDLTGRSARDAVAALAARGYRVLLEGSGLVTAQTPVAGTALGEGETVTLALALRDAR